MATSYVFGWQEHVRRTAGYCHDLQWMSTSLCCRCLREPLTETYSVPFEVQLPSADGTLTWPDFRSTLQPENAAEPNTKATPWKPFIPCPVWAADVRHTFSVFAGRLARWREMQWAFWSAVQPWWASPLTFSKLGGASARSENQCARLLLAALFHKAS